VIKQEFERARQRHSSGRCLGDRCSRSFCVLDCQVNPSEIRNDLPDLERYLLAEGHRRPAILSVIREMQKGAAHLNKERLLAMTPRWPRSDPENRALAMRTTVSRLSPTSTTAARRTSDYC